METVHASSREESSTRPEGCVKCGEQKNASPEPGNPGSFEEIHKKVKDLYPINFEGARLTATRILSNHFRVYHTLTMSSVTPSGYKFGALYQGTTMIGNDERYPHLECAITPNGKQSIKMMHTLGCRCRIKINAQTTGRKYEAFTSALEYRSDDCTVSVALKNPNFTKSSYTLVLHFLQSVSSRLALGGEFACLRDPTLPTGPSTRTVICAAARYSNGPFTVSATLGEAGFHACCHRRASEQLDLGAEIQINAKTRESLGSVVYRVRVPSANFVFRGILDSAWTITGLFEKKLSSSAFDSSLLLSGALNHKKGQFRVGVGLNVG